MFKREREPNVYDIVQNLLDNARKWPLGSLERANLLAEAQLIVSTDSLAKNSTAWGAINYPR